MLIYISILLVFMSSISLCSQSVQQKQAAQVAAKTKSDKPGGAGIAAQDMAHAAFASSLKTLITAPPASSALIVIKTPQERVVEKMAASLAALGKIPQKATAKKGWQLSDELRKWALQNESFRSSHLAENPDVHWLQLSDNKMTRYSGGNYTFDRELIIQRQLKIIANLTGLRFVRNEDGLVDAIRRMNPSEIAKRKDKTQAVEYENSQLESENAKLNQELAELERSVYGF